MAGIRLKHFSEAPVKHREVFCSPLIGPISLGNYLDTSLIKCVNVGGEMASKAEVHTIEYEWVKNLYLEAKERNSDTIKNPDKICRLEEDGYSDRQDYRNRYSREDGHSATMEYLEMALDPADERDRETLRRAMKALENS